MTIPTWEEMTADWDDDGDLDLISGGYMYSPTRYLHYFENTGNSTNPV